MAIVIFYITKDNFFERRIAMKKRNGMMIKEIVFMGIFSTLVMDIGEETIKAIFPLKESMKPQYLGRWILNMFEGVFTHDNIQTANQFYIEIPVSISFHYFIGIFLAGVFLWLRNSKKIIPNSKYMGLVYGWVTIFLPWFIMFPAFGFGILGLSAGLNNLVASVIAHSFFGLGITLWLGFAQKIVLKNKQFKISGVPSGKEKKLTP